MQYFIIVVFFIVFIGIGILSYIGAKKRRRAMMALAIRLGLNFYPDKDRDMARRYRFLDKLRAGRDRYAFNILSGGYHNHNVTIFDYHYKTGSGKDTHNHYLSFFLLQLTVSFPELVIAREGLLSKIGQALGYDDIDFESHEFSRKFCVRSKDKKFAYDVCNARMIEYLLSNDDLSIEIEDNILAISFNRRLSPDNIEQNLNRLIEVRSLLPDYLFSQR